VAKVDAVATAAVAAVVEKADVAKVDAVKAATANNINKQICLILSAIYLD
jgi:hypothetical protein